MSEKRKIKTTARALSKTDIGVSLNLALEWAPKIAKTLNKPSMPIITTLDLFYKECASMSLPETLTKMEIGYLLTASYKGVINDVLYNNLQIMNKEPKDKNDIFIKITSDELTLDVILKQIKFVFRNAVMKSIN